MLGAVELSSLRRGLPTQKTTSELIANISRTARYRHISSGWLWSKPMDRSLLSIGGRLPWGLVTRSALPASRKHSHLLWF